jgi:hypothetical protein
MQMRCPLGFTSLITAILIPIIYMKHSISKTQLDEHLFGVATPKVKQLVQEHLATGCASCTEYVQSFEGYRKHYESPEGQAVLNKTFEKICSAIPELARRPEHVFVESSQIAVSPIRGLVSSLTDLSHMITERLCSLVPDLAVGFAQGTAEEIGLTLDGAEVARRSIDPESGGFLIDVRLDLRHTKGQIPTRLMVQARHKTSGQEQEHAEPFEPVQGRTRLFHHAVVVLEPGFSPIDVGIEY